MDIEINRYHILGIGLVCKHPTYFKIVNAPYMYKIKSIVKTLENHMNV